MYKLSRAHLVKRFLEDGNRKESNMIDFVIEIAGRAAAIRAIFDSTKRFCAEYLCERETDFAIEIYEKDILFERARSERTDVLEGRAVHKVSDAYLETLAVQRKLAEKLFEYDTLLFHGSVVAVDGEGYLFTAKSGTGKSTHTRLWREAFGERAVTINDDKPFLRLTDGCVTAYGSPWNGKHGLSTNDCVPLRAVCILQRGTENTIHSVTAAEALPTLFQQSHRPGNGANFPKYMELIDRLAGGAAFYRLFCNMDPSAAVVSYEGMKP